MMKKIKKSTSISVFTFMMMSFLTPCIFAESVDLSQKIIGKWETQGETCMTPEGLISPDIESFYQNKKKSVLILNSDGSTKIVEEVFVEDGVSCDSIVKGIWVMTDSSVSIEVKDLKILCSQPLKTDVDLKSFIGAKSVFNVTKLHGDFLYLSDIQRIAPDGSLWPDEYHLHLQNMCEGLDQAVMMSIRQE